MLSSFLLPIPLCFVNKTINRNEPMFNQTSLTIAEKSSSTVFCCVFTKSRHIKYHTAYILQESSQMYEHTICKELKLLHWIMYVATWTQSLRDKKKLKHKWQSICYMLPLTLIEIIDGLLLHSGESCCIDIDINTNKWRVNTCHSCFQLAVYIIPHHV